MPTNDDVKRCDHTAARLALLDDDADDQVAEWIEQYIGKDRLTAWGAADTSVNPLQDISNQLSTPGQYGATPAVVGHEAFVGAQGVLESAGFWTSLREVEFYSLGAGSYVLRADWSDDHGLTFRLVKPSDCFAVAHRDNPSEPVIFWELRLRWLESPIPDKPGKWVYAWDQWDVSTSSPSFRVVTAVDGDDTPEDITDRVITEPDGSPLLAPLVGERYPYLSKTGKPEIPYQIYKSRDSGDLWNWRYMRGAFRGAMNAMLLSTYTMHAARDASGEMAIATGLIPPGDMRQERQDGSRINVAHTTPGAIWFCEADQESTGQPAVFRLGAGANLKSIAAYASGYVLQLLSRFGINADDAQRMSQNPSSGVALHLSNKQKRDQQVMRAPLARRFDLKMIRKAAIVHNAHAGTDFPEDGYSITYQRIPLSPQEEEGNREEDSWSLDQGLKSRVEVYQERHPGTNRAAALEALARVARDEAELELELAKYQQQSTNEV